MRRLCLCLLLVLTVVSCLTRVVEGSPRVALETSSQPLQHMADIFSSGIFDELVDSLESNACKRQMIRFKEHADTFTLWAMQMVDATSKLPSGILGGAIYHLGHFDECLAVDNGESGGDRITGKYCLATVEVTPKTRQKTCHSPDPRQCSAWQKLEVSNNKMKLRRNRLQTAICIPSACTGQDLQTGLQFLATKLQTFSLNVTVKENMCQTGDRESGIWLTLFWWALIFYVLFLFKFDSLLMKIKTNGGRLSAFQRVFDARSHWQHLTSPESHEGSEDSIACIHGGRVICLAAILIGHRAEEIAGGPLVNGDTVEAMYENFLNIVVLNGHLLVDVFFTISGYLLAWNLIRNLDRGAKFNVVLLYLLRYLRLTPALMLVVAFEALVLFDLSSGPLWSSKVGREVQYCRDNWWTNLLYINNYVHPEQPCVGPSWYLACDMQMFLVASLIVLGLQKRKHLVFPVLMSAISGAVAVLFVVTYMGDLDPTLIPAPSTLGHSVVNPYYMSVYVASHCRAGPYLVGMLFAYWLHSLTSRKAKIPQGLLVCGWSISPVVQFALFGSAGLFYPVDHQIRKVTVALYAALHRTVFAVGVAFYITAGANGQGGFLNRWMCWSRLRPLSRLTYSLFLCHSAVQMFHIASVRSQLYLSASDIIWLSLSDLVISVILSTILYLTVERPVMVFATVLFEMTSTAKHFKNLKNESSRRQENGNAKNGEVKLQNGDGLSRSRATNQTELGKKKQG